MAATNPDDSLEAHAHIHQIGLRFLSGGGEVGQLLRQGGTVPLAIDNMAAWPAPVKTLIGIMFSANQPMYVAWGPERHMIYNDAYIGILRHKHPKALGQKLFDVWSETTAELLPLVNKAYAGEPTQSEQIEISLERGGRLEQAWFSFFYAPVRDEAGDVIGIFCACNEITQRILAAREVAAAGERQRRLFESAPGFMAILQGPAHVFEYANQACRDLLDERCTPGRQLLQALPELADQGFMALMDRVFQTGQRASAQDAPVRLNYAGHVGKTGEVGADSVQKQLYIDYVFEPITDSAGQVTGIFVQGSDVTQRFLARQEVLATSQRYKGLIDAMSEAFVLLDDQYRLLEINAEGLRLSMRPLAEMLGRTHWELWPGSVGTPVEEAYRQAMTERKSVSLRHYYNSEGFENWLELRIYPVPEGGVAAFFRDINSAMRSEAALRASEARFRAAVSAIGVMWTNNADGEMVGPQPGWSQITGQTEAQYAGYGWTNALHPDDVQPTVDAWQHAVRTQSPFQHEHRLKVQSGEWRLFTIRAVPVFDADQQIAEWVGVHIDITEARKTEEALRLADQRKDEFLATLAHELRNPLAPIRTAARILAQPDVSAASVQACSDILSRQSRHMALLLDDLLDVSRITSGRLELKKEVVHLRAVVEAAVEAARPGIAARQHQLTVSLPDEAIEIEADSLRLSQVLTNLLNNAAKYTDPHGRISLGVELLDTGLQIAVTDSGIGLKPESLAQIFVMFSQVRSGVDRSEGGLGIGLSLARGLIELHGGSLHAHSDGLGHGTTLTVMLPQALRTNPQILVKKASSRALSAADASHPGLAILVVDDNRDAADTLALLLAAEGHRTVTAYGGDAALDLCAGQTFDIGILDIGMPGMSGHQLAARMRDEPWGASMLLVALTGWGQESDQKKALAAGFDRHLSKPVNPDELTEGLTKWAAIKAQSAQASSEGFSASAFSNL